MHGSKGLWMLELNVQSWKMKVGHGMELLYGMDGSLHGKG